MDVVSFAHAFGAEGYAIDHPSLLEEVLTKAIATKGPVLVDIPIDYWDNARLFQTMHTHLHKRTH